MIEGFSKLCWVDELKDGEGRRFIVDETEIAVFKIDNKIHALSNVCPHQHTALIYNGFLENGFVICPAHGWKFNLETGKQSGGEKGLDSFPVVIQDGEIFVKIQKKEFKW